MIRDAVISPCRKYRLSLTRIWDEYLPILPWCMLNPSKADAEVDDPTIGKVVGFSRRAGYGGAVVVNLYAYRATDPTELKRAGWLRGDGNDDAILKALAAGDGTMVCAWGANARGNQRPTDVVALLRRAGARMVALRTTADGIPCHPLMLPYNCTLQPWPGG